MALRDVLRVPDPAVARDVDLRRWRATFVEATAVADLQPRRTGCAVGVVARLLMDPAGRLEVTVEDGTGTLTAVFSGRSRLPGADLGSALMLTGTTAVDADGERRMHNPAWELVASPEQRQAPPRGAPRRRS